MTVDVCATVVYADDMTMTDEQRAIALNAQAAVVLGDKIAADARYGQADVFRILHDQGVGDRELAAVVGLHFTQVRNIRLGRRSSATRRKAT